MDEQKILENFAKFLGPEAEKVFFIQYLGPDNSTNSVIGT
jgi:hypothetical protein